METQKCISNSKYIGDLIEIDGVRFFCSTRHCSEFDLKNYFPQVKFNFLKQVHGNKCIKVTKESCQNYFENPLGIEADAHWTGEKQVGLVICTADCLPILIFDKTNNFIASCHAGWRGLVSGAIAETMKSFPLKSESYSVVIGPHIHRLNFEVHLEVARKLKEVYGGEDTILYLHKDEQKTYVDLTEIALWQLSKQGIAREDVYIFSQNTYESTEHFSFRREGKTGRLYSFLYLS
jgi:hypothetical protein